MSFIKHGDGKIVDVLDETNLTDEQKQAVKKMSENNSSSNLTRQLILLRRRSQGVNIHDHNQTGRSTRN